eukprot:TRINITY_DN5303_c0_g1_i1.p1 TRINITY_DN5303_c0_g1~~TRINITY_DN5303_c0_g1_i1.p1  ORF type:complete len:188 (-),score=51.59 TRINITY_DN5303_c0_g1_i1:288-851(-)
MENAKEAGKDILAGAVGGAVQCLLGHPLDTVKIRMQTQSAQHPKYSNTLNCFSKIIREEGFMALYRGIQSPLFGLTFFSALQFFSYATCKKVVRELTGGGDEPFTLTQCVIAGYLSGSIECLYSTPIDLLKIQLQSNNQYKGFFDCARVIAKKRGVFPGYYQGFKAMLLRDGPGSALYFGSYGEIQH